MLMVIKFVQNYINFQILFTKWFQSILDIKGKLEGHRKALRGFLFCKGSSVFVYRKQQGTLSGMFGLLTQFQKTKGWPLEICC